MFDDFGCTYWLEKELSRGYNSYKERWQVAPAEANLVGSQLQGQQLHAPALDIDLPASLVEFRHSGDQTSWLLKIQARCGEAAVTQLREVMDELDLTRPNPVQLSVADHGVVVVLTQPAFLVPSSTAGHFHLYLNKALSWADYRKLLKALRRCDVIEDGFYRLSLQRGQTFLRPPGVLKQPAYA